MIELSIWKNGAKLEQGSSYNFPKFRKRLFLHQLFTRNLVVFTSFLAVSLTVNDNNSMFSFLNT
jgi:hypothetical protein